jgi:hypothetical protein
MDVLGSSSVVKRVSGHENWATHGIMATSINNKLKLKIVKKYVKGFPKWLVTQI